MSVGGARLRHVGTPHHDEAGVVPVGGFRHVGLLPPSLRRGGRQVAIPIIKTHTHAANQREIAGACGIGHHRHGGNRREADNAVGAILFGRVDVGRGDDLIGLFPFHADKATQATLRFIRLGFLGIFDDGGPGFDGFQGFPGLAPQFRQWPAYHRIFQPVGAVQIPGITRSPRTATRFMVGQLGPGSGIIGLLGFPGHQTVFDIDFPATRTSAIHPVRGADNLVMLPSLPVAVLPGPALVGQYAVSAGKGFCGFFEEHQAV